MSKQPIKIATAQSRITASISENGETIRQLMKTVKEQDADLVHFTEGALSGYAKSQIKSWDKEKTSFDPCIINKTVFSESETGKWKTITSQQAQCLGPTV